MGEQQPLKRVELPGHWAASFQAFGDVPVNDRLRDSFESGLGVGFRTGYGFWEGLSVDIDFQYDLLLEEDGSNKIRENKNLLSLAPGLRYTLDASHGMSVYVLSHFGATFDYTQSVTSTWNLSYVVGTGVSFDITENLAFGPEVRFRHVLQDERDDNNMKIQILNLGVSVSYLYD